MTYLNPASVQTTVRAVGKLAIRSGMTEVTNTPVPFSTRSFIPGDYVLHNGWPTVPDVWVHTNTSVTSDGSYYDAERPDPFSTATVGLVRFIASTANYNNVSGIWSPYYSSLIDYKWVANIASPPLLEDITYLVGKELITTSAFRFFPGARMDSMFNSGFDQSQNFGMAAVLILHSPGNYPIFSILDPDVPGTVLGSVNVTDVITLTAKNPVTGIPTTYRIPMLQNPLSMTPLFLIFVYTTDGYCLYAGPSMTKLTMLQVTYATPGVLPLQFSIGTDNMVSSTGAFQLMDLVIFDPADINLVASALTSVYGATI